MWIGWVLFLLLLIEMDGKGAIFQVSITRKSLLVFDLQRPFKVSVMKRSQGKRVPSITVIRQEFSASNQAVFAQVLHKHGNPHQIVSPVGVVDIHDKGNVFG